MNNYEYNNRLNELARAERAYKAAKETRNANPTEQTRRAVKLAGMQVAAAYNRNNLPR
jgi:hypothetical protein